MTQSDRLRKKLAKAERKREELLAEVGSWNLAIELIKMNLAQANRLDWLKRRANDIG